MSIGESHGDQWVLLTESTVHSSFLSTCAVDGAAWATLVNEDALGILEVRPPGYAVFHMSLCVCIAMPVFFVCAGGQAGVWGLVFFFFFLDEVPCLGSFQMHIRLFYQFCCRIIHDIVAWLVEGWTLF